MDLWYPRAQLRLGPASKVWADENTVRGIIDHSADGAFEASMFWLDDESVDEDNHYIAPSWHFFIRYDGSVYQHYPLNASPFHAGSRYWNTRLIGVEHEGKGPLTEQQLAASIDLNRWIAQQGDFPLSRGAHGPKSLFEHKEVSPATPCPSGRIPWDTYLGVDMPQIHLIKVGGSGLVGGVVTTTSAGVYERVYDLGALGQYKVVVEQ